MKYIKIILFNLFVTILLFCILELTAFLIESSYEIVAGYNFKHTTNIDWEYLKNFFGDKIFTYSPNYYEYTYFNANNFRPASIVNQDNPPALGIVILGCSFAFGSNLSYKETFSYLLSDYTKRNIYNLGLEGASLREMLYLLRETDYLNKIIPPNEKISDVIYLYIYDHTYRLGFNHRAHSPIFRLKNNSLEYTGYNPILQSSYLVNLIKQIIAYKSKAAMKRNLKLEEIYIKELNKEIKKKFDNAKLTVLVYWDFDNSETVNWEKLKEDGITVLNLNDLVNENLIDKKYQFLDTHPNKKAWELITPAVVKELNL